MAVKASVVDKPVNCSHTHNITIDTQALAHTSAYQSPTCQSSLTFSVTPQSGNWVLTVLGNSGL